MARNGVTAIVVVLMMAFGMFFGIELATRGMERIQGPVNAPVSPPSAQVQAYAGQSAPASGGAAAQKSQGANAAPAQQPQPVQSPAPKPKPQPQPITADSGINKVGNQIGDLLQTVAHGTIRTVVSLLDGLVN